MKPGLIAAIGLPLDQVYDAVREWIDWQVNIQLLGVDGELASEVSDGETKATAAFQNLADRKLEECDGTSLEAQVSDLVRIAADAARLDFTLDPDSSRLPGLCADPGPGFVNPEGTEMFTYYSVGSFVPDGTVFHFFIDTSWGQASISSVIRNP